MANASALSDVVETCRGASLRCFRREKLPPSGWLGRGLVNSNKSCRLHPHRRWRLSSGRDARRCRIGYSSSRPCPSGHLDSNRACDDSPKSRAMPHPNSHDGRTVRDRRNRPKASFCRARLSVVHFRGMESVHTTHLEYRLSRFCQCRPSCCSHNKLSLSIYCTAATCSLT